MNCALIRQYAVLLLGQFLDPQEYLLVTHLMRDYFPLVRPVENHRDVIDVLMDMTLVEIVDMVSYPFNALLNLQLQLLHKEENISLKRFSISRTPSAH